VMRSSWLLVVVLAGCGRHDEPALAATAPPAPPRIDPIAKGVPHGGQIAHVAVTEQGDAALTFDNVGGVRLWPALDGTRPPVPVSMIAPVELALAHAGDDLLAASLDEAGAIDLLRLGRDGAVRSRVQLPADVAYEQVLAVDEGVLARSADHTIEWFAPDGQSRGKLVAEPAHRMLAIAARRGRAVAVLTDGTKAELRWVLMLGGTMLWGAAVKLPAMPKDGQIALSPSHRQLAIADAHNKVSVYDIGFVPSLLGQQAAHDQAIDLGFVDEDHLAIMGSSSLRWWEMPKKPPADPWEVTGSSLPVPPSHHMTEGGAVADSVAVTGFGAALALTDTQRVRYLGYQSHGVGNIGTAPSSLWVSMSASHVVWLDDKLAIKRDVELRKDTNGPWLHATPVGDRHVVVQAPRDGTYVVELIDLDRVEQPIAIGTYTSVDRVDVTPDGALLGVLVRGKLHRFQLDLATNKVEPLASFRVSGSVSSLRLLDPARAGGITAITLGWDGDYDEHYTVSIYRAKGKKQRIKPFRGTLIDIDATGTMYVTETDKIIVQHGTKQLATIPAKDVGQPVAVNADGSRFALRSGNDVVVIDREGTEQWRTSLWGAAQLAFMKDGTHLAVRAMGGLVLLSAQTGERAAVECGWSFGVTTTPPVTNTLAFAPVCEDPTL
jgi:hypothetical protein